MQIVFENEIARIPAAQWDALVGADMPLMQHAFLHALEASGSVAPQTGWEPRHVRIHDDKGVVAVAPGYIKHHSYGEYVFDWSWAEAYHRNGLAYYPKYVTAIPFTPVVGPRLLIAQLHQNDAGRRQGVQTFYRQAVMAYLQQNQCSSWHLLFPEESFASPGWSRRTGTQFHWYNRGYRDFDGFLAGLSASRRKSIRKERQRVAHYGLHFDWVCGGDMGEQEKTAFYRCYAATYTKRGQAPYLNAAFFDLLWRTMPAATRILLVRRAGAVIAASLFFQGEASLFGRYWGCLESLPGLHFEACYYRGIEHCIAEGLKHFDAGAQGEHKLLRGFEPVTTQSYHWIDHPEFAQAVDDYVQQEAAAVLAYQDNARDYLPYKKDQNKQD